MTETVDLFVTLRLLPAEIRTIRALLETPDALPVFARYRMSAAEVRDLADALTKALARAGMPDDPTQESPSQRV